MAKSCKIIAFAQYPYFVGGDIVWWPERPALLVKSQVLLVQISRWSRISLLLLEIQSCANQTPRILVKKKGVPCFLLSKIHTSATTRWSSRLMWSHMELHLGFHWLGVGGRG
jgi:hypothetical protein